MCIKKFKLPYFGLSLLFLLSLSLSYLPGESLQEMTDQELLMKLAMNSQEIATLQQQQEKKLKLSIIEVNEVKNQLQLVQKALLGQQQELSQLKTIQEESEKSIAKTSQSFQNFKKDMITENETLNLKNDILSFGLIVVSVILIYKLIAPP